VGQRLGIGEIVNRYEFNVVAAESGPDDIPANAAKAIDTYFYCHLFSCLE
jgi:hypothetical protein